jgi:transcriptional regulator with XRE-family HTH domain
MEQPDIQETTAALAIGERLRTARTDRGIGVRAMSRLIQVSPSTVSQIELGNVMPSVNVLYRFASMLEISLDELFATSAAAGDGSSPEAAEPPEAAEAAEAAEASNRKRPRPVVRHDERSVLRLATGVRWERLSASADPDGSIEHIYAVYDVGGESCPADALVRHSGKEFGFVISGRLSITLGFEQYDLEPGDSISFESTTPHRFWTVGDEPATVVWHIVHDHV